MIALTADDWRDIFPHAPEAVITAFASSTALDEAGITKTPTRLAYFCANVEHECSGFTVPNLTENINYSAAGMARTWPSRFKSAADVQRRFGTSPGWQKAAFDEIYGGRMGNRPGTHDGSTYIGRGGPQITGRDGYREVGRVAGLALVEDPLFVSRPDYQPLICAAFWLWKSLNGFADRDDFVGCVKAWNGGTNGLADRRALMAGNDPIIARLTAARGIIDVVNDKLRKVKYPLASDIESLQRSLNALGRSPALVVDGQYGSMTRTAVMDFQAKHGLVVDGIAGPMTMEKINSLTAPS